ncbi:ABC transporter ATP-binding protein [Persicobacter psychrovividus]|uniref:Lipoprotein-releasing system ATP-binding protein LolD n=1 Tax=Persicobacter psychrovividus TaxID=387638 RepID=A0ABN6L5V5_9BACT|nr:lipoprotein-releasing system ATP-binding protein LolD [Persicobacter psychrovividus]
MLKAKNIHRKYGHLEVLKGVDLLVKKGEIVSIVGASGAGKSTLLQIIGTLDHADSGEVYIANQEIGQLNKDGLARFRNQKIGFIFQFHNLLPEFSAIENVCLPAFLAGTDKETAELEAQHLLDRLGLGHRMNHKPGELSGGEQQRVAVARALINKPDIIFADEPSGNLDSIGAQNLHALFFELRDELDLTFVIVTHNPELADMTDRKLTMVDGQIIENHSPNE